MSKTTIAIFLSLMFATLTIAPNIIVLLDKNCDVSVLIDSTEEEERKGEEKVKDLEIEIPSKDHLKYSTCFDDNVNKQGFQINNYSSIVEELTSPPPEANI